MGYEGKRLEGPCPRYLVCGVEATSAPDDRLLSASGGCAQALEGGACSFEQIVSGSRVGSRVRAEAEGSSALVCDGGQLPVWHCFHGFRPFRLVLWLCCDSVTPQREEPSIERTPIFLPTAHRQLRLPPIKRAVRISGYCAGSLIALHVGDSYRPKLSRTYLKNEDGENRGCDSVASARSRSHRVSRSLRLAVIQIQTPYFPLHIHSPLT
eukprot:scaffold32277_cov108-Isochrysis_galbana.AAC.8